MDSPADLARNVVTRVAGRLKFPLLFLVTATLFVADLLIPDLLPFADEIILGLATVLFATWGDRGVARWCTAP